MLLMAIVDREHNSQCPWERRIHPWGTGWPILSTNSRCPPHGERVPWGLGMERWKPSELQDPLEGEVQDGRTAT